MCQFTDLPNLISRFRQLYRTSEAPRPHPRPNDYYCVEKKRKNSTSKSYILTEKNAKYFSEILANFLIRI